MNFCLPYLRAQLEIVKPKVIVAWVRLRPMACLGRIHRGGLVRCEEPGMVFEYSDDGHLPSFLPAP